MADIKDLERECQITAKISTIIERPVGLGEHLRRELELLCSILRPR